MVWGGGSIRTRALVYFMNGVEVLLALFVGGTRKGTTVVVCR